MTRSAAAIVCIGILAASCTPASDPSPPSTNTSTTVVQHDGGIDVQGHRGARGLSPENTLPSFETALDLGVTTLELDLHFTSDGEIVVWHDPDVSPEKCGLGSDAQDAVPDPDDPTTITENLAVRALSVSQLRQFDCNRNPDPSRFPDQNPRGTALAGDDFGIVTLTELLAFVDTYSQSEQKTEEQRSAASAVRFNIETKRDPTHPSTIDDGFDGVNAGDFELRLLAVIDAHGAADRVVVQSFDERSIQAIHAQDPTIELALLTSTAFSQFTAVVDAGVAIWSPSARTITETLVGDAHAAGLSVATWTVNSESEIRDVISMGVDGIITDRPDIALNIVAQG